MKTQVMASSKHIFQVIVAVLLVTLLLLGGAAPYGQDDPNLPPPSPTPYALLEAN